MRHHPRHDQASDQLLSSGLADASYKKCFQALFGFVLKEKSVYYGQRNKAAATTAEKRLSLAAEAVRTAASHGATKLTPKTLQSIIDHITQTLPGPNELLVPPLRRDYVRALTEVLAVPRHSEFICRKQAALWQTCVDFFLDVIIYTIPNPAHGSNGASARDSPMPGTPSLRSTLTPSGSSGALKQVKDNDRLGDALGDALTGLHVLVSTPNAPVVSRFQDLTAAALRVLRISGLSLSRTQTLCFSIINSAFAASHGDDPIHATGVITELVPLMSLWWKPEKVSQDEFIRTLRNEITRTVLLAHLNIEQAALKPDNMELVANIEYFLEPLWQEYSRRSDGFKLQTSDITFTTSGLPADYLQLGVFGLRPNTASGESQWALVHSISLLEGLLIKKRTKYAQETAVEGHRTKKRRLERTQNRLEGKLNGTDDALRQTALQALAFLFGSNALSEQEARELAINLLPFTSNKDIAIASWALIASARYVTASMTRMIYLTCGS